MIRFIVVAALITLGMSYAASEAFAQSAYKPDAGRFGVEVIDETWRDDARAADPAKVDPGDGATTPEQVRISVARSIRGRRVPVRVYLPLTIHRTSVPEQPAVQNDILSTRFPVVIFSHGMGGSREGYEYIARHLASHGYLVVLPQHAGSDKDAIFKAGKDKLLGKDDSAPGTTDGTAARPEAPRTTRGSRLLRGITDENTSDPANLENRPKDLTFVIDRLMTHPRLSLVADTDHIAAAGHSFGSYTTMAVCGVRLQVAKGGAETTRTLRSFRDERVRCGIAMSPQGQGVMGIHAGAWESITVPMLLVTGTKDMGQGDRAASWRHQPFDALRSPDTYLLNIRDATHMTFSGRTGAARLGVANESHLTIVKQTVVAFLDWYLCGKPDAKAWLVEQAVVKSSDGGCEFEHKMPRPASERGK